VGARGQRERFFFEIPCILLAVGRRSEKMQVKANLNVPVCVCTYIHKYIPLSLSLSLSLSFSFCKYTHVMNK